MNSKKIKLRDAFRALSSVLPGVKEHLTEDELIAFTKPLVMPRLKNKVLEHIGWCFRCAEELKLIQESKQEALVWDFAFALAATTTLPDVLRLQTEAGKYSFTIRRDEVNEKRGIIVVEINPQHFPELEERRIEIRDKKGQTIFKETIHQEKLTQQIEDMSRFDFSRIIVKPC